MTPHQFIGLGARLFSVWLALTSLTMFHAVATLEDQVPGAMMGVRVVAASLYLATAALLWFFPMLVAHKLLPKTRYEDHLRVPSRAAMTVVCITLGLIVLIFRAAPNLVSFLTTAAGYISVSQPLTAMGADRVYDGVIGVVELVVGALLITRATRFSDWALPSAE